MSEKIKRGDANMITRDYFDSLLIEMRHIGAVLPDTSFTLYGESFDTPIMTAALSHLNGIHPDGMVELARGAKAANAVMWTGMGDDSELEAIRKTGAKTIKIIKPHQDNGEILRRIAHAKAQGCFAVGMDIDHAFGGSGEYDVVLGLPMHGKTLDEIRQFVQAAEIPFIIKGVLSVRDALMCKEAGVQGIVISHHHGILDYAVPPAKILPSIRKALGNDYPIFIDCGIESGLDVFKCLALGATAVSVGRALMTVLRGGAADVTKEIVRMNGQLKGAMARTASPDITHIDPTVICDFHSPRF